MANNLTVDQVKEYFNSLGLAEWQATGGYIGKGGQAAGIEVRRGDEVGFFRMLNNPSDIDQKRFRRELKILTDEKFKHKNIVQILEFPAKEDEFWYISKKGTRLDSWWDNNRFQGSQDDAFTLATRIIIKLASGLEALHDNGVVHRDIKPANIVVDDNGEPVLIDFGIVFEPDDERITPVNEAAGTEKHSPDIMKNRLDDYHPWVDVFQLAQVYMWLIAEDSAKNHWRRPLHWLYVNYPADLTEENRRIIKAISALCSIYITSPKNSRELRNLIEGSIKNPDDNMNDSIQAIMDGVHLERLDLKQQTAYNIEVLQSEFPMLQVIQKRITGSLINDVNKLAAAFPIEITLNKPIEEYTDQILKNAPYEYSNDMRDPHYFFPFLEIIFNSGNQKTFVFRMSLMLFVPSLLPRYGGQYPQNDDYYRLAMYMEFSGYKFNDKLLRYFTVFFSRSGDNIEVLLNSNYDGEKTVEGFINYVPTLFNNPEAWRAVQ